MTLHVSYGPGGVAAATQAEQESASSTTVFVSPGRQHSHPSAAKWWCTADVAGTIDASYNMTSVTDNGTGDITFNIATDFSSVSWCPIYTPEYSSFAGSDRIRTIAAGTLRCDVYNFGGVLVDPAHHNACGFGDQ